MKKGKAAIQGGGLKISRTVKFAAAFLVFIAFAYLIFENAPLVRELVQGYGLVGLLIASIIAHASILLPMPIDIVLFAISAESASVLEVVVLGIIVGFGAAIGEMTAYLFGLMGIKTVESAKHHEFLEIKRIRNKLGEKGMFFIFLGAFTPFPFDIIGIAAGLIKCDPKKFFLAALIGKLARFILIGLAGYYGFAAFNILVG